MARARTVGSIGAPGSGTSGTVSVTCEPPLGQAHGRGAPALQRRDLEGVLDLCRAEGWPSLPADPARADRILTNPGVTTYVAVDGEAVAGFASVLSDGELQAYLATLVVARDRRRQRLGTRLVRAAFAACG